MAAIAGIKTKKDLKGKVTHITIDVKRHKEIIPTLNQMGLMPKTKFQKECEGAISIEEFRANVHKKLAILWKKHQK